MMDAAHMENRCNFIINLISFDIVIVNALTSSFLAPTGSYNNFQATS